MAAPTITTEMDKELQEAFDVVDREKEVSKVDKEKTKGEYEEVRFPSACITGLFCVVPLLT